MRLVAVLLFVLSPLPAFAGTNDDCKEEAILAARDAFAEAFGLHRISARQVPVSAEALESPDYEYNVTLNKGSGVAGAWKVVLDQQCNVERIQKIDGKP